MRKFLQWLQGMVEVRVAQDQIERFLNLCRNRGLQLYQVAHQGTEYRFRMSLADYWRIRPIARKIGVLPLVSGRKGFPFLLGEWSRRKVFTGGFLLFALLIFFLTRMVWSIDIEGCSYHTEEALLEFLEQQGVRCGMFYQDLDYKQTEDLIRLTYQDISWVSVERVGTKLHIRLKESELVETKVEEKKPADLIASKDGIVESIVTRSGTPMVAAGDEVKKGDVLISGIVEITGDYDAPVGTHLVYADGDVVLASTQGYYSVREMEYEKKVYIGTEKTHIGLKGFGYQLEFFPWKSFSIQKLFRKPVSMETIPSETISSENPLLENALSETILTENTAKQTDCLTEYQTFRINPSLKFPVSLQKTTYREYEMVRVRYRDEEAVALEEKKLADYLAKLEQKEITVLETDVTVQAGRTLCVAEGTIQTRRRETRHRRIKED